MDKRIKIGAGVLLAVFALGLAVFAYRGGPARLGAKNTRNARISLCARKPPFRLFLRFVTLIAQTSPPSCAVICTAFLSGRFLLPALGLLYSAI